MLFSSQTEAVEEEDVIQTSTMGDFYPLHASVLTAGISLQLTVGPTRKSSKELLKGTIQGTIERVLNRTAA